MSKSSIAVVLLVVLCVAFMPFPAWTDLDWSWNIQLDIVELLTGQTQTSGDISGHSWTWHSLSWESEWSEMMTWNHLTWDIGPVFFPSSQIIISEVFFDWSDERIELANIWSGHYSGSLTIRWIKSADFLIANASIPPGWISVRGDSMAGIVDKTVVAWNNAGLSISDSQLLQVTLYSGLLMLDSFSSDAQTISSLPNGYWLEKVRSGDRLVILPTSSERRYNVTGTRIANPWKIYTLPPPDSPAGSLPDLPADPQQSGIPPQSSTWVQSDPKPNIRISEIHPSADVLPEYVELYFGGAFAGELVIEGLGSSAAAKRFSIHSQTWQRILVTDSFSWFTDLYSIVLIDSVSLTDGWERLTLKDLSGHTYHELLYTWSKPLFSRYEKEGWWALYSHYFSPGFSEQILDHYPGLSQTQASVSPTETAAKETYYQSLYNKRKDRYYELKTQISAFGVAVNTAWTAYIKNSSHQIELVNGSEEFAEAESEMAWQLKITALLPDPKGKDEWKEQITIMLLSGSHYSLSSVLLLSNKKKVILTWSLLTGWDSITLQWTFNLLNKPACVSIQEGEFTHDTFCYGQPSADKLIGLTGNISDITPLTGKADLSRVSKLSLSLLTWEACMLFGDIRFDCVTVKPILDEKTKAKYDKKVASLQTKFENKQRQYTWLQERYKTMKSSLDLKRRKYYQQVKSVRADYKSKLTDAGIELKIRKNYGKLLQSNLKDNRYMVRQHSDIAFINTLLESNLAALENPDDSTTLTLHGQTFKVWDIRKQHMFATDPAVMIDSRIWYWLSLVYPAVGAQRNQRLEIRYAENQ